MATLNPSPVYVDGQLQFQNGLYYQSTSPALTAHSGGTQALALPLTAMVNRLAVVAAQGDSVSLPAAVVGLFITVINRGAFAAQVFGAGTDTINSIATATGFAQGPSTSATYTCSVAGNWEVPVTDASSTVPVGLSAANNAIPQHVAGTYSINTAGVDAMTLAAPTTGVDDGLVIVLVSSTANAHTLTATGLLVTGSASVNVATFAAFAGASLTLMANKAKWAVLASNAVAFT